MTIRLLGVDFLWVVHSDHASICHRYGDMTPQIFCARTWTRKERREKEKSERKGEGKEKGRERVGKGGRKRA